MKKLLLVFLFALLLSTNVYALEDSVYKEQFEKSGAADIYGSLDDKSRAYLDELGISPGVGNAAEQIDTAKIWGLIGDFVKNGAAPVLISCGGILLVVVISSLFGGFGVKGFQPENDILGYAAVAAVAGFVLIPVFSVITSVVSAIQGCCKFMFSFVPVFAGILLSGGAGAVSAAYSAAMLGAAEVFSSIASFLVLPISGMYLAVSITGAVSDNLKTKGLANALKKTGIWIVTFSTTIFIGIMKIQTIITASADGVGVAAVRFAAGTGIPLVGSAISEAVVTVKGCMNLLSSSAAIWGTAAFAVISLPVMIEIILWRIGINISSALAEMFTASGISELLKSIDTTLSFLLAVLVCVSLVFVISLTIVSTTGVGRL